MKEKEGTLEPITIRLDDGAEVTAQVEESDFTKLNKATTLSQNGLFDTIV